MTVIDKLAEWTAQRPGDWPPLAVERAVHAVADTVGCIVAAKDEPVVRKCARGLARGEDGGATIQANKTKARASTAACVNATAAHALEIDDNYYPALTHASALTVPALIALAEELGSDGPALIDAYIVGLEIQAAVSRGVNRSHYLAGWHGTGTIGCIGVAGASARLMGLNHDETANALSLAVSMAAGIKNQFGAMAKPLQCGLAARNGISAAELAQAGVEGSRSALEGKHGFLELYGGPNPLGFDEALEKLDNPPAIEEFGLAPKRHACCGSAHKGLDCIEDLRKESGFEVDDISDIAVWVGRTNKNNLRYDRPEDGNQARFSMQYCTASLLHAGRVWLTEFDDAAVNRPEIRKHLPLTTVHVRDIDEETLGPDAPISHAVKLTLKDGTVLEQERAYAKGTIFDPFDDADRFEKFRLCCEQAYPASEIEKLWTVVGDLEGCRRLSDLTAQL